DELTGPVGLGLEFDAGVDVLGVFTEDDHVGLFRLAHGRRHPLEVAHGTQADVQVQFLAQGHVQGADAAAHRGGQGALDGYDVLTHGFQGFFGQPDIRAVDLGGLFAGVDFHPVDLALATVGLGHSGIHDLQHHRGDVLASAVAL